MTTLDIETAEVFEPLLEPARYKGAFGGRSSGKSHFFADLLVEEAERWPSEFGEPLYAICIREVQKTLSQSAKRTIEGKIKKMNLGKRFEVQRDIIKTPGGGRISFQGMQNHTAESIKSLEGYGIAWVEEGQTMSNTSLTLLRPTMRKKSRRKNGTFRDSEIWASWNPGLPTDPIDAFFRGNDPELKNWKAHPAARLVESNWEHNPWFDETSLDDDRLHDLERDPDMYDHVWGGAYWSRSDAQVFRHWKVEEFEAPAANIALLAGADWGFTIDPSVLVLCFIVGRKLYVWREVWAKGHAQDTRGALFDKIDPDWTMERARDPNWKSLARRIQILADSAEPATIDYLKRHGFPKMVAAEKGPGSVEAGVTFLASYDIVVHPQCVNVIRELTRYAYKVDPHTDTVLPVLSDTDNHTIDSLRYAVENVRRMKGGSSSQFLV